MNKPNSPLARGRTSRQPAQRSLLLEFFATNYLRPLAGIFLLLITLPLTSCSWFAPPKPPPHPLAAEIVVEVNRFRLENGQSTLRQHNGLALIATPHSEEMLMKRDMSHDNFHKRVQIARTRYNIGALSENVQNSWGYTATARSIVQQWKDSPKHRDNMLGRFHFAGVGVALEEKTLYSTLLLGSPRY